MKGYKWHRWLQQDEDFLKENWQNGSNQEIADRLGVTVYAAKKKAREFGLKKTKEAIRAILKSKPNAGQFKKGQDPHNTKSDNCISVRIDKKSGRCYQWIRIEKDKWMMLHVYNWLQAGKEYNPKNGDVLRFKNSDTMNASVENIELITRNKNLQLNKSPRRTGLEHAVAKRNKAKAISKLVKSLEQQRRKAEKGKIAEERRKAKQEQKRLLQVQKEAKKRSARSEAQWQAQYKKNREKEKAFAIKQVDYSQMVAVRIDHKTIIYAKPGQDPEQVKEKYLSNLNLPKNIAPAQRGSTYTKTA